MYHDIRKIGIGCCGFRSTCIEYDINEMFSKIDQPLEDRVKQKKKQNRKKPPQKNPKQKQRNKQKNKQRLQQPEILRKL